MTVKCLVAGGSVNGPSIYPVRVLAFMEASNDYARIHKAAKKAARGLGAQPPFVVFDAKNSPVGRKLMLAIVGPCWAHTPLVDIQGNKVGGNFS